jgi:hypothetical protein
MTPTIQDWRIDLMRSHPRQFEIISAEPERSSGYSLCEAGWRDVLERLCSRIEAALQRSERFGSIRMKQKYGVLRIDWHAQVLDETSVGICEAANRAVAGRHALANSAERKPSSRPGAPSIPPAILCPSKSAARTVRPYRRNRPDTLYARYDQEVR